VCPNDRPSGRSGAGGAGKGSRAARAPPPKTDHLRSIRGVPRRMGCVARRTNILQPRSGEPVKQPFSRLPDKWIGDAAWLFTADFWGRTPRWQNRAAPLQRRNTAFGKVPGSPVGWDDKHYWLSRRVPPTEAEYGCRCRGIRCGISSPPPCPIRQPSPNQPTRRPAMEDCHGP